MNFLNFLDLDTLHAYEITTLLYETKYNIVSENQMKNLVRFTGYSWIIYFLGILTFTFLPDTIWIIEPSEIPTTSAVCLSLGFNSKYYKEMFRKRIYFPLDNAWQHKKYM